MAMSVMAVARRTPPMAGWRYIDALSRLARDID